MVKPHNDFANEAELVAAFCALVEQWNRNERMECDWVIYHETGGFDLLMACRRTGIQVGIEAKMALNLKVINQALSGAYDGGRYHENTGPDYRAVLVPEGPSVQRGLTGVMRQLGLTILRMYDRKVGWGCDHEPDWNCHVHLPDEESDWGQYNLASWYPWLPARRVTLPEYIPDVEGGHPSPVSLTQWKIKAIKVLVLLHRNGVVHRSDLKALDLAPTRWTQPGGFLLATPSGYVSYDGTPDLKAQHPRNYAEIEADFEKWCPPVYRDGFAEPLS